MSQLPYVLLVLFSVPGGGHTVVETKQQYESPVSCNIRALIENEQVNDRTYMCVTRDNAEFRHRTSQHRTAQTAARR